jgi:hypothetical protein
MDQLRNEAQNKMNKLKNFDPTDWDSKSEDSNFSSENNDKVINSRVDKIMTIDRKNDSFVSAFIKASGEGNSVSKRILIYKTVIKWLDIITSLLLLSGIFISQMEQANYYEINKEKRIVAIKVVNCILNKNFSTYNSQEVDSVLNYPDFLSRIDKNDYTSVKIDMSIDELSSTCRSYILFSNIISGMN